MPSHIETVIKQYGIVDRRKGCLLTPYRLKRLIDRNLANHRTVVDGLTSVKFYNGDLHSLVTDASSFVLVLNCTEHPRPTRGGETKGTVTAEVREPLGTADAKEAKFLRDRIIVELMDVHKFSDPDKPSNRTVYARNIAEFVRSILPSLHKEYASAVATGVEVNTIADAVVDEPVDTHVEPAVEEPAPAPAPAPAQEPAESKKEEVSEPLLIPVEFRGTLSGDPGRVILTLSTNFGVPGEKLLGLFEANWFAFIARIMSDDHFASEFVDHANIPCSGDVDSCLGEAFVLHCQTGQVQSLDSVTGEVRIAADGTVETYNVKDLTANVDLTWRSRNMPCTCNLDLLRSVIDESSEYAVDGSCRLENGVLSVPLMRAVR